jgi:hypothetical protein
LASCSFLGSLAGIGEVRQQNYGRN